ncbi:MAG TPA: hypothetical protein VFB54_07265 [Burkholderiales bacterium]|nr:hypothetical protein [Burkholderiales bacterium]
MLKHSDVYKIPRPHEVELPRPGDLAEVRRSHCKANAEAGLLVQVMGKPHWCYCNCADCGLAITEYFVEVHCDLREWQGTPGPWFYPIDWLKRIDPRDPVQYERIRNYRFVLPTDAQLIVANK